MTTETTPTTKTANTIDGLPTNETAETFVSLRPFAGFPCRIFPMSRPLTHSDATRLLDDVNAFLTGWASHGAPVTGAAALASNRFLVIAHKPAEIAGCSGDALQSFLNEAGRKAGVEWTGGSRVFYRSAGGTVADTDRPGFRKLVAEGVITPDTIVFDTILHETDALLEGRFAVPARTTWHARLMG